MSIWRKPRRRTVVEDAARGAVEQLRPDGDPPRLLARDLDHAESPSDACEPAEGLVEGGLERTRAAHLRLEVERAHAQDALAAVGLQVGAPDEPVAVEEGQHVVAVFPLGAALVDLDHVAEAEDPLDEGPVPEHVVERAEQDAAGGAAPSNRASAGTTTGAPPSSTATRRTRPSRDEPVDDRAHRLDPAGEAAVLGDARLGQRAACPRTARSA